jgi:hypothetical protein
MTMTKEYIITLQKPPTSQIIREGMMLHRNRVAQGGRHMVNVIKESGYYYFFRERDLREGGHGQSIYSENMYGLPGIIPRMTVGRNIWL